MPNNAARGSAGGLPPCLAAVLPHYLHAGRIVHSAAGQNDGEYSPAKAPGSSRENYVGRLDEQRRDGKERSH